MAVIKTNFTPEKDGFQFINRFELHLPVKYTLPFGGQIDLSQVVYGLCGGMCFAALDYYYGKQLPPTYGEPDKIDKNLFTYLCERQLESLQIPVLIKVIQWMLLEDKDIATRMARTEAPQVRAMLDKSQPVVLGLIRVAGLGNPTLNHQVLAIGYDYDLASKDMTIFLYDPNHPCQDPYLKMNLAKPSAGINLTESTGEETRGFFVVPYSVQKSLPAMPPPPKPKPQGLGLAAAPVAAAEQLAFKLQWPVDSRRINQRFGENPESYRPFGLAGHEGLDFYALSGANVYATANGTVYQAGFPAGHPYGRHIRIHHQTNGVTYETIYAHLSKIFVQEGQTVSAGDQIGAADNTGNSIGSHLHLTLKVTGKQTPGYPPGIVDPYPFLDGADGGPKPLIGASGITVYTVAEVNLRDQPGTDGQVVTILPAGEPLSVLGNADEIRPKIGQQDQWLRVQTAGEQSGFVAAWLTQSTEQQAFPPSDLVVYPYDTTNLRGGPGTGFNIVTLLALTDPLTVLGDANIARSRLGQQGQWLQVETLDGQRGFVAAWLVHVTGQAAPSSGLVVSPTITLNVRARASTDANILTVAQPGDALEVLGEKTQAQAKIGQADQWLNVRTPGKFVGYVAAWLVNNTPGAVEPVGPTLTVFANVPDGVNLRAQASVNSPKVNAAAKNEPLTVIETDLDAARAKIGQPDTWIFCQNKSGSRGWVAAWFLSAAPV